MPKLDRATALAVNKAESGGGTLLDEDEYLLKLLSVKVSPKPDRNGSHYWIWEFEVVSGAESKDKFKGKKTRSNTGLADNQHWFLKMFFEAFEVKPNVDTDTLVGKEVKGLISQHVITSGTRKGQLSNDINSLFPASQSAAGGEEDWADEGGKDDEPDF